MAASGAPASAAALFEPITVGGAALQHRVVYAPLTRCAAHVDLCLYMGLYLC